MATISHQSFVFSSKNNWGRVLSRWAWQAGRHTEKGGGGCHAHYWQTKRNLGENLWLENTLASARMFWFVFFSCKTQRLKFVVVELGKFFCRITIWRKIWFVILLFSQHFSRFSRLGMFVAENWRKMPNWWQLFFIVRRVLLWAPLRHQCHRDLRRQVRPHPPQRHLQLQRLRPQPLPLPSLLHLASPSWPFRGP